MSGKPTIVLIHGAFADGGSWAPVTGMLLDQGYAVRVPALGNRGLVADSAYIRSVVEQIDGPVLLVGHSYGGAVIGVAGAADNVVGLVFVAGFALDEGETITKLQSGYPAPELATNLVTANYPNAGGQPGTDVYVKVDTFPQIFAAGLDPKAAAVFAVSQRPIAAVSFDEPASAAGWKTKPSWGTVSKGDHAINPDVERFGYQRAGSTVTELDAPHLAMQTNAAEVAAVIAGAADSVS